MPHLAGTSDVQLHIGESILAIVVMDSGFALRAPRNDTVYHFPANFFIAALIGDAASS
jgi:hypothetical protein